MSTICLYASTRNALYFMAIVLPATIGGTVDVVKEVREACWVDLYPPIGWSIDD
jgi:hypothetical protein